MECEDGCSKLSKATRHVVRLQLDGSVLTQCGACVLVQNKSSLLASSTLPELADIGAQHAVVVEVKHILVATRNTSEYTHI